VPGLSVGGDSIHFRKEISLIQHTKRDILDVPYGA
jgi:hypothetical protein